MVRFLLLLFLVLFVARALWRLVYGILEGASSGARAGAPDRGVKMVRDPVCGTFVVPGRALPAGAGDELKYFCSERCREKYKAGSRQHAAGRS